MAALTMAPSICSEVGRRSQNEDAVFGTSRLVAVADGVGGAVAGEVASRVVINALASLDKRRLSGSLDEELRSTVVWANDTLAFTVACRPRLAGMASTLSAVALSNDGRYVVANVGDSRSYLFRDGSLVQLTHDDSLVQALVDSGALSPAEARAHPQRSVVLEALDGRPRLGFEVSAVPARAGDRLLVCSDGLTDFVSDAEIAAVLDASERPAAAEALVALALDAGSRDNVSVVVADVVVRSDPAAGWS
jgi:serine/threonine protein phosphatase PrpC